DSQVRRQPEGRPQTPRSDSRRLSFPPHCHPVHLSFTTRLVLSFPANSRGQNLAVVTGPNSTFGTPATQNWILPQFEKWSLEGKSLSVCVLSDRPVQAADLHSGFAVTRDHPVKGADMKRCPNPRSVAIIATALCMLLIAVSGYAQTSSTGNIYGKVQAKDGSVLPGVTVTLSGVGAPQNFVTDSTGNFRFISLSPGTYTLKADLAGYGSATRQGVAVRIGQNADVTLSLNPSVSESITVTAEAPLLDVRKAGTSVSVTKVELENIPTS